MELMSVEAITKLFSGKIALFIRGGGAGLMAFLWLVVFALSTANYSGSVAEANFDGSKSAAQSAAAFSFFGIVDWVRC